MPTETDTDRKPPARRKAPRKISPRYLENAALFHLKRYACSVKQLRRVLLRKVARSLKHHGGEKEQAVRWVDALLERFSQSGYLNDASFAKNKARSLRNAGKSVRAISAKLREKGLSQEHVQVALSEATNEVSEVDAAFVLARKKKLGPFRIAAARKEMRQKDLAALARAGFSYATAKKVVDAEAS